MKTITIELCENTLGAQRSGNFITFDPNNVSYFVEYKNRIGITDKKFPDTVHLFFKGSGLSYKILSEDFRKALQNKGN